jgi:hypothetical protein
VANLYGVANPVILPASNFTIGVVDVACPLGVETNVMASPNLVAISNGYFYVGCVGAIYIQLGATAPTNLVVAARINNGADIVQAGTSGALLVANALVQFPVFLFGGASQTAWQGLGSPVQISVNPNTQPVTVRASGSVVWITLYRAPDQ